MRAAVHSNVRTAKTGSVTLGCDDFKRSANNKYGRKCNMFVGFAMHLFSSLRWQRAASFRWLQGDGIDVKPGGFSDALEAMWTQLLLDASKCLRDR